VDPSVGVVIHAKLGERVTKGTVMAQVYFHKSSTKLNAEDAYARCQDAFVITSGKATPPALIRKVIP
jgi:thymidine phosphorylase